MTNVFRLLGRRRLPWIIIGAIVVVVTILLVIYTNRPTVSKPRSARSQQIITHTADKPSESKTEAVDYEWSGGHRDPKKIVAPTIGVDAYIQNMGVDQNKQVAAPSNIYLAGWFVRSVRPGARGLSIIDGHIDGRYQGAGVFYRLSQLKVGDHFSVVRGDDRQLKYKVMSVQTVANDQAVSVLFSQNPTTSSQLNLITCGGSFNGATRHYESRTIVAAALE